ncbi:DUF3265 domain-containing protein [Vibrio campbellii]|nr:DUF3265 domain-containing protein [Vibrio campbellii]
MVKVTIKICQFSTSKNAFNKQFKRDSQLHYALRSVSQVVCGCFGIACLTP